MDRGDFSYHLAGSSPRGLLQGKAGSPIAVQLDGGVSEDPQHQPDGGALVAVDPEQRRLVPAAHHHQVASAARVGALQLYGLSRQTYYTPLISEHLGFRTLLYCVVRCVERRVVCQTKGNAYDNAYAYLSIYVSFWRAPYHTTLCASITSPLHSVAQFQNKSSATVFK